MAERKKPHVPPVDEVWLALGAETRLSPEIEIVDSHIHLWDFSAPPYLAGSYAREAVPEGITAAVYVECTMGYREDGQVAFAPVGEVEFACAQGESQVGRIDVAAAIIGWADLTLGANLDDVFDALERAGGGRFRGVRTRAAYDPDPVAGYGDGGVGARLLARDDYRDGVARLHARGHVLDLYVFHTQLAEVVDLACAFPALPIILDHIGVPLGVGRYADEREQVFADWKVGISALGHCPNVMVKIGGFAIPRVGIISADGRDRPPSSAEIADTCRPWVDHCFAAFGAGRCMFGSNVPVDKAAMPLVAIINAMKHLTADLPLADREAFFSGNARRVYRI